VQPCVRPCLCGSWPLAIMPSADQVPGQKPAFEMNWPKVGCPDQRIDRLCITCCWCSQPSHRDRSRRECDGFPIAITPLAIMAHAILAILLASATATTLVDCRANNAASQGGCLVPWILA